MVRYSSGRIHVDEPFDFSFDFPSFSRDDRSSFTPTPEAAKANGMRQVEVPVTTLNEVARTGNAPCPDIVKIDAEGFDLRVVAGASELVGKTDIFLLEAAICGDLMTRTTGSGKVFENSLGKVIETMARAGYRILDITELNRSPKHGALWLCEVAFLRNASRLLDGAFRECGVSHAVSGNAPAEALLLVPFFSASVFPAVTTPAA